MNMLRHLFLRRLFFVLPDEIHAQRLVADLETAGISHCHMHAIAGHGGHLTLLPPASQRQRHDAVWRLEQTLWYGNLALFTISAIGLLVAVYFTAVAWAVIAAAAMFVTVTAGTLFVLHVPNTHLDEFRSALTHREILLMVDVPKSRVAEIETLVERRHPEAEADGVGWTIEGLRI
jgi:hypothetical protein